MAQIEFSEGRRPSGIKAFFAAYPPSWLFALGAAFALMTWFPGRVGVTRQFVSSAYTYLTDLLVVLLLVVCVVVWARKPDFRLARNSRTIVLMGVVMTLCCFAQFAPVFGAVALPEAGVALVECLYKLSSVLLMLLWIEQMSRFSVRALALSMGVGCLVLAAYELLLLGLQNVLAQVLFAFAPMASTVVLVVFLRTFESVPDSVQHDERRHLEKTARTILPTAVLCLGVLMSSLVGSSIQTYVKYANPASMNSALSGAFDAAGLVLTAVVLIAAAMAAYWRARVRDALFIMPSVLSLAYVLSIAMTPEWALVTYAPLAMARRLTLVFWLVVAAACPHRFMASAVAVLVVYRLAQTFGITPLVLGTFDYASSAYSLLVVAEIAVTTAICPLIASTCLHRSKAPSSEGAESRDVFEADNKGSALEAERRQDARRAALDVVSSTYGLSNREDDVLALLAEGWRAAAIADKLVLSPATVKNHMNRIYGKLGVHSQEEVLYLIESEQSNALERASRDDCA